MVRMKKIVLMILLFLPLLLTGCCKNHITENHVVENPDCYVNQVCFSNQTETRNGPGRNLYIVAGDGYFNLAPGKSSCFGRRNKFNKVKVYNCGITSCENKNSKLHKRLYATFKLDATQCVHSFYCASPYNGHHCRCNSSSTYFNNNVISVKIK